MKRMAKTVAILLALTLLLTACGGGDTPAVDTGGSEEPAGVEEEVVLRFSWWGGDERHEKTLEAIALFEERNPGVKIEAEYGGWSGFQEKYATQMAGNTAADIMQVNWNWLYIFSKDGNGYYDLNDLSDYVDLSNYDQAIMDQVTINNKVNALPLGIGAKVFYYNETTYAKAGVEIPKTFEDLFAAADVFKEQLGNEYYPIDVDAYGAFLMVLYYLEQTTGQPFMNENNEINYTEGQLVEALEFYNEMVERGVTPSMQQRAGAGDVPVDQTPSWIQGKYGGTYEWDSAINKFQAALEGEQTIVTGDYLKDLGSYDSALAKVSMTYAINKDTKHPEIAAQFLNFLVADPDSVALQGTARGIPANKAAIETLESMGMLSGLTYEGNVKATQFLGKGINPYFESGELQDLYRELIDQFGYGRINAQQTAERLINEVNSMTQELAQ
ncbi:extracellular solute-binding protein, family 1 [Alkaliphilus metalliredigens QYMF]|uniref:Extracellular solute-binding protein, family 1 n=1 Tax=Alkaliphilus metalliredigens (strain QYMF) TaxID=293826 RepID=A6TLQ0_ALKMQ|nr:ABC transporter substrate-binding protein [Alkaliphilus metalliredigens]ABR47118.1 extracellular solute-binding protein, family 1 [Alkaliphilus metalliredigens QYMF]